MDQPQDGLWGHWRGVDGHAEGRQGVTDGVGQTRTRRDRKRIRGGEAQMTLYGWSASFPGAYDYVCRWMTCAAVGAGFNDGGYCNERIAW